MRKNTKFLFIALAGLMISSCAGEEESNEEVALAEEKTESCYYSYEAANSEMSFTAYKFLGKTGVGGTFTEINVEGGEKNKDAQVLIEGLSFNIPISSISTKDESRDGKINEFFFGEINTEVISGEVKSLEGSGQAVLAITMNEITQDIEVDYTLNDTEFSFEGVIDVLKWDGQAGIDALNEECKDLHIDFANGDTESKLWSDVTISFSTKLNKDCE